MKKKIILKTLGIIVLLAGLVLAWFTGSGILEGNRTYDLFRKIRVDMKSVYADIDQNGLEAVKDEYREVFTVVDQIDALGGKKAQVYLDDVNTAYGLIDTIEATEQIVSAVNSIGNDQAQEGLDMVYTAFDKASSAFGVISATNGGDVTGYLPDIEAVLAEEEDLTAAREALYEKYASDLDRDTAELVNGAYDENKAKQLKAFFTAVLKMVETDGKEQALAYFTEAAEASGATTEEFVREQVGKQIAASETENAELMTEYTNQVFRLIEDQGSGNARTYLQNLLNTMKQKDIPDARAYLNDAYGDSEENVTLAKYLDSAFQMMDEKGTDYATLHGGDICADASGQDEEKALAFLAAYDAAAADTAGTATDRLNRLYSAVTEAGGAAGGRNNLYLNGMYTTFDEVSAAVSKAVEAQKDAENALAAAAEKETALAAAKAAAEAAATDEEKAEAEAQLKKAQKEYDDANKKVTKTQKLADARKMEDSAAQEYVSRLENAIAGVRDAISPELRGKAQQIQNDMCALIGSLGLEKAKKYTEYATQKALDDKTLRIDALGTGNVAQLDALDNTKVFLMRNKARLMILAVACLIIGIVLMCIRPKDSAVVKMSREERKSQGSHMGLSASRMIANSAIHAVLILISIIWLIPFISIVMQSLRVESTHQVGYIMPEKLGFANYADLFTTDFTRWYTNTFIMALVVAVLQTVIVLCMSYTLSRFRFKIRKGLMKFMLILGMFPGMLTMIILYRVLKDLGLTQTHAVPGLILVYVASSGMGYYVSKGFFDTIPKSLDEAARVDGATRAKVLMKIILPLSKPIVIYTVLTAFMGPWGDYVFARYISFGTSAGMNAAVGLNNWLSKDQIASRYTMFCAGGVLVAIPVAVLFMCLQKYYVEGVTGGAVKG